MLGRLMGQNVTPRFVSAGVPMARGLLRSMRRAKCRKVIRVSLSTVRSRVLATSLKMGKGCTGRVLRNLRLLSSDKLGCRVSSILAGCGYRVGILTRLLRRLSRLGRVHS